jgi:hypothetical protein
MTTPIPPENLPASQENSKPVEEILKPSQPRNITQSSILQIAILLIVLAALSLGFVFIAIQRQSAVEENAVATLLAAQLATGTELAQVLSGTYETATANANASATLLSQQQATAFADLREGTLTAIAQVATDSPIVTALAPSISTQVGEALNLSTLTPTVFFFPTFTPTVQTPNDLLVEQSQSARAEYDAIRAVTYAFHAAQQVDSAQTYRALAEAAYAPSAIRLLAPEGAGVMCVAMSLYQPYYATCSTGGVIQLWSDVNRRNLIRTFTGHRADVTDIVFMGGYDEYLLSGSNDGTAIIWDVNTGQQLQTLSGHTAPIFDVQPFQYGQQYLFTASYDNTVIMWDSVTGAPIRTFEPETESLTSFSIYQTGTSLAPDSGFAILTASRDRKVDVWDAFTGSVVATINSEADLIAAESGPYDRITIVNHLDQIEVWDPRTGRRYDQFPTIDSPVTT